MLERRGTATEPCRTAWLYALLNGQDHPAEQKERPSRRAGARRDGDAADTRARRGAVERGVRHHDQAAGARRCPPLLPHRFKKVWEESVALREAYLVDGMLDNAQLATEGEAGAARRTIQALDAGAVREPWRVARDLADMKAKNVDKSRMMQDKPTAITVTRSLTEIFNQLEALNVIDGEVEEDADVVPEPDEKPDQLPPAAA
jgi:hypothetical protein